MNPSTSQIAPSRMFASRPAGAGGAKMGRLVAVATLAVAGCTVLAGCHPPAPDRNEGPAAVAAASASLRAKGATPGASASAAASSSAVSFYAAQYLRIIAPSVAAQNAFRNAPAGESSAQLQALANTLVVAAKAVNNALLEAQWPPTIAADVRAAVTADAPVFEDLANVSANSSQLASDSRAANAAANVLRADLGVPPVPTS